MPIHDWTRVDAGTFHDFHSVWIAELRTALNTGLLPDGYYAMAEQHAGQAITDVLTLQSADSAGNGSPGEIRGEGPVAVAQAPPKVSRKFVASPETAYRELRRTIAVRSTSGHRIVAMIEIVSPGNKDRRMSVDDFVEKAWAALHEGIHLLVVDLLPPGACDPGGMHGMIWQRYDAADYEPPPGKPLVAAAYAAYAVANLPEAYIEPLGVGDPLPLMPLFLQPGHYVNLPLEETYMEAYRGVPAYFRGIIEGR